MHFMKQKGLKFFTRGHNGVQHILKMQDCCQELKEDSLKYLREDLMF
jgi:hypothetical protein